MANSYTQIHIHFVFAVKYRGALIGAGWKERLHQYITGIFRENNHKMLQINSMPDHIHIFIGMRPHQSISSLIQNVKSESSKWIKNQRLCSQTFAWQEGYGAFSYAKSQVPDVVKYIQNQEAHHQKETFLDEYKKFLTDLKLSGMNNTYLKNRSNTMRSYGTLKNILRSTNQLFRWNKISVDRSQKRWPK